MTVIEVEGAAFPGYNEAALSVEAPRNRRRPDNLGTITLASVQDRGIDGYGQLEAPAQGTPSPALSPIPCASMGAGPPSRSPVPRAAPTTSMRFCAPRFRRSVRAFGLAIAASGRQTGEIRLAADAVG
jgi:hypothetical protein